jgi:uncharacterized membrane protein
MPRPREYVRKEDLEKAIEPIANDIKDIKDNHLNTIEKAIVALQAQQKNHNKLIWWLMGIVVASGTSAGILVNVL